MTGPARQVRRRTAVILLVIAVAFGVGLAAIVPSVSGEPTSEGLHRVPAYVARAVPSASPNGYAAGLNATGFAAVVKPVLPAVGSVCSGSAAADAGLRRRDVIEQINRHPVTDVTE